MEEVFKRLRRGGIPGLIAGEEKPRSKVIGGAVAALVFLAAIPRVGVLVGLGFVIAFSVLWGLFIRIRKRRAGVPLDSADY
jgi:hypothetical protein